jgi:hypothetical protein
MITQEEFVADCYLDYAARGLEPGNPADGNWNKCHYPAPRSLDGTEWVWLLEEHHAVQAVLQSEEYNHPCIFSWERKYLSGEWQHLCQAYDKWMTVKNTTAAKASASVFAQNEDLKQKRIRSCKNNLARWRKENPKEAERVMQQVQKAREKFFEENPEKYKEFASKGAAVQHTIRVQCTVTGYVSTPGPLSRYQKARGIDTSNRVRLN